MVLTMFGICGYFNKDNNPIVDNNVINRMCSGLQFHDSNKTNIIKGKNYALAVVNGWYSEVNSNEKIKAIITGSPYWVSNEYKEIADKHDHAKAILSAYLSYKLEALNFIKGQFSLVIIDEKNKQLLITIDRMGTHPMSYATTKEYLLFGSTADSIKKSLLITSTLSKQSIYDYLFFHMVPSPSSIYEEQRKLLPAQYLFFNGESEIINEYWLPSFIEDQSINIDHEADKLKNLLKQSVRRNIKNDNTGAFLSGGVDSTTIAGFMSENVELANTFSIGFDAKGYDEIEYVHIAERFYGLKSHEYYVTPKDVIDAIPIISSCYDEPYGNSSAIPAYYCALFAKNHGINTLLAGDGGDELFAGNERYAKQLIFESYKKIPYGLRKYIIEPISQNLLRKISNYPFNKIRSFIEQANIPLPKRLESYNYIIRDGSDNIFNRDYLSSIDERYPITVLNETYNKIPDISTLNKMLFLDWKQTLADNDLRKVNKMCTLNEVEVKYPMLDDEVVEFSTKVPSNIKLNKNKLRYFYKYTFRDHLPKEILNKQKHGFGLPFGVWLRTSDGLREIVNDSLSSFRKRNILTSEYLDLLLDRHDKEHAAFYGTTVWVIMMLELWLQEHLTNK